MKHLKNLIGSALIVVTSLLSCEKVQDDAVEYIEVNKNNISGMWELTQWNGNALSGGTYMYIEIVRNDETYTMFHNMDSFSDVPHKTTGSYYLYTDEAHGAVIRGNYDHSSGDWTHRYMIKDLTKDSMTWVAEDAPTFVQKFSRIDSIPVRTESEQAE